MSIRTEFAFVNEQHMMVDFCLKCGFCCRRAPCAYGYWNEEKHQCIHLTKDNLCNIYDRVKHDPANPAMGGGCCSSIFNEARDKKMTELKNAKSIR